MLKTSFLIVLTLAASHLQAGEPKPQQKSQSRSTAARRTGVHAECASVEAVIDRLQVSPKGEFETTADYEARRAKLKIDDRLYCFVFEKAHFEFDADAETYLVRGPTHTPKHADKLWILKKKLLDVSQYEARNGFGATVTVMKGMSEHIGFTLAGDNSAPFRQVFENGISVSVTRAKAQTIKKKGQTLVLVISGRIAGPPRSAFESTEPTFTSPLESSTFFSYLPLNATEFSVRVAETNELLGYFDGLP